MYIRVMVAFAVVFANMTFVATAQGQTVEASWYALRSIMSNGKRSDPTNPHQAAHKSYQFGTRLLLRNPTNGRTLCVQVEDRGPFVKGRTLDVTRAGAERLGFKERGHAKLEMQKDGC